MKLNPSRFALLNQIASIDGLELSYDAKGNLLADKYLEYGYDAFNRLTSIGGTGPDGSPTSASYTYDALNRRVQKVANGKTINFYYDGQQVVEERDAGSTLLRQYLWGQYIDELMQQREYQNAPSGQVDWYPLTDMLYRSVGLTDNNPCIGGGNGSPIQLRLIEAYDTDVYGRTRIYKDPGPDGTWFSSDDTQTFTPLCRYIYTGREYDPESGLYYYRARYYHPDLGRFISRDPLLYGAGDMNLYGYTGGNPLNHTDPSGAVIGIDDIVIGIVVLAVIGAITGMAFDALRQGVQIHEAARRGEQRRFSWSELSKAGLMGAVVLPAVTYAPILMIPLIGMGLVSSAEEYSEGNWETGTFDLLASLLAIKGAGRAVAEDPIWLGRAGWTGRAERIMDAGETIQKLRYKMFERKHGAQGVHAGSQHGPDTTFSQQAIRVLTGERPPGSGLPDSQPRTASRFLRWRFMYRATADAVAQQRQAVAGNPLNPALKLRLSYSEIIGEGATRIGPKQSPNGITAFTTKNALFAFDGTSPTKYYSGYPEP